MMPRYQVRYGQPVWHVVDVVKNHIVGKGLKTLRGATKKAIRLNNAKTQTIEKK